MAQEWSTLEETQKAIGGPQDSPFNSLLSWLAGRFEFEKAELIEAFSVKFGPATRIIVSFTIDPSTVPDSKEIDVAVRDFMFKLEDSSVDCYYLLTVQRVMLVVFKSLGF